MGEETDIAEPVSSDVAVVAEQPQEPSNDKSRKRKKHLYKSIRERMEFYLGDVNISKNRLMHDHVQGQPFVYVDLSLFLTFNKIKLLTSSVEELAKAISGSESLQLSEDGTKVCRKTPILKKENGDECTIYVEQVGPDVDHDLISKVFSEFGPVDYVSIPKFFSNNKNKGFAFVEFKEPESAKKALEAFNARGCCLSPHMAPEELMSIKNFTTNKESNMNKNTPKLQHDEEANQDKNKEGEEKGEKRKKNDDHKCYNKKMKTGESEVDFRLSESNLQCDDEVCNKNVKNLDRTEDTGHGEESSNQKELKRRKRKKSTEENKNEEANASDGCGTSSKKLKTETEETMNPHDCPSGSEAKKEENEEQSDTNPDDIESAKQKKRRKKKKKVKKDKSTAISMGFKILSKKDWKHLRNKYLNMQKNAMRSLKQHLSYSSKWEKTRQAPTELDKSNEKLVSGTVIKIMLDEPITNTQGAKHDMRVHPEIKYVDVTENSPIVYLRTSTPEFCSAIMQARHWPNMEVLKGDEESQYWMKMKMDRETKHVKKLKQNSRGRSKLLKKAERFQGKHIAFDAS